LATKKEIMITRTRIGIVLVLILVACVFFYKTLVSGLLPFPGDLLIAEYKPWRTYSYLGYTPGSYPHKAQYFDTLRQLYPWKTEAIEQTRNSTIPLWNPHNFSGSPLLANIQSALFYPLNIVYALFSQHYAWTILVILQPLLASIGMYLFMKRHDIDDISALLSALTYGYCMFMSVFLLYNTIGHVAVWIPFLLLSIEELLKKQRVSYIVLFVVSSVCCAFAGHLQLFVYVMLLVIFYTLLRIRTLSTKPYGFFILLFALSLLTAAVQLIPTMELILFSARAPQELSFLRSTLLLQPYQLALFLSADIFGNPAAHNYLLSDSYPSNAIYVGIVPFLFALIALTRVRTHTIVRLFTVISIMLLLVLVHTPLSALLYAIPIPLFSTSSPSNAIILLSFCLAALAGLGMHLWRTHKDIPIYKIIGVIGVLFSLLWIAKIFSPAHISTKNLIFSSGLFFLSSCVIILGQLQNQKRIFIACLLVIIIATFDSWYFFQKFNPFVPTQLVFPQAKILHWLQEHAGLQRFWGYASASIEANMATQYGLYTVDGYDPLYPRWYGQLLGASRDGKLLTRFTNTTRSDAVIDSSQNNQGLTSDTPRKKLLDLLGVRYILDRTENASDETIFPTQEFRLIFEEDGWKIFENQNALPRAWMVSDVVTYTDATSFEKQFFDPAFDPAKTVLLPTGATLSTAPDNTATATISSYTPNRITIQTQSKTDQLLILSDTYFPGWHATVDGNATPIMPAFFTLRAVSVPAGARTVILDYRPISFAIGSKTSMMGVILVALLCIAMKKRKI
jgi:hypothetical protein